MKKCLYRLILFSLGAFATLTQAILIREYLVSFQGNELSLGIFYASWFFWIASGAVWAIKCRNGAKYLLVFLNIYALAATTQFLIFRNLKYLASIQAWELFSFQKALPLTVFANAPVSLLTGLIFVYGCFYFKSFTGSSKDAVSSAYIYESLGSFLAGISITFLLTNLINTALILLLSCMALSLLSLISGFFLKNSRQAVFALAVLSVFIFIFIFRTPISRTIGNLRWQTILPEASVIDEIETPYRHLAIAEYKENIVITSDGKIIENLSDRISAEQDVSLFVAMADMPINILILGEASETKIHSLLSFQVKKIVNVYQDKAYFYFLKKHAPDEIKAIFQDKRTTFLMQDPRKYLADTEERFDLIIINKPEPSSLYANKYYTKEFYNLVKKRLSDRGVAAAKISSDRNFLSQEMIDYGSSVYRTLNDVFEKIAIAPQETAWFFTGDKDSPLSQSADELFLRADIYTPRDFKFKAAGIYSLVEEDRAEFIKNSYLSNPIIESLVNSDNRPLTYFLNLLFSLRYSDYKLIKILKIIFLSGWAVFIFPVLILFALRICYLKYTGSGFDESTVFNAKLYQFFSGSSSIIYYLILLFLFQNRFGTIFQYIGLIIGLFMLGIALGSLTIKKITSKASAVKIMLGLLFLQLSFYLAGFYLKDAVLVILEHGPSFILFSFSFLILGTLTGASYPLAANIMEDRNIDILPISGMLESLDHWGASLGALIAGIILIPLLGVFKAVLYLSISTFSLIVLIMFGLFLKNPKRRSGFTERKFLLYPKTLCALLAISVWMLFTSHYLTIKENIYFKETPYQMSLLEKSGFEITEQPDKQIKYIRAEKNKEQYYVFYSSELETSEYGFAGPVNLRIITDKNYKIEDVSVLESKETPLYLNRVIPWLDSFKNKYLSDLLKPQEIDALTGATYTSRAILQTVKKSAQKILHKDAVTEKPALNGLRESVVFVLFILAGLVLFYKNNKVKKTYQILLVVIAGFIFNLQLSFIHILNILGLQVPAWNNIGIILLMFLPFALAVFYGRIYCGWFCPFGAIQELVHSNKPYITTAQKTDKKAKHIKYFLILLLIILFSITGKNTIFIQDPLLQITSIFSKPDFNKLLTYLVILFSIFIFRFW
ncbi:MAG: FMN-binding protein, partial [Candidatus Omnitrophica bacterium]|nr:FMN-binding protein [Candidatus Omnitrophota bacterium]